MACEKVPGSDSSGLRTSWIVTDNLRSDHGRGHSSRGERYALERLGEQLDLVETGGTGTEDELVAPGLRKGCDPSPDRLGVDSGTRGDRLRIVAEPRVEVRQVRVGNRARRLPQRIPGQRQLAGPSGAAGIGPGLVELLRQIGELLRRTAPMIQPSAYLAARESASGVEPPKMIFRAGVLRQRRARSPRRRRAGSPLQMLLSSCACLTRVAPRPVLGTPLAR